MWLDETANLMGNDTLDSHLEEDLA